MGEAIATAAVGFLVWDDERRYVAANAAACELLGCTLERIIGATLGERKRFDEVRRRLEVERLLLGREDAGEDDGAAELAQAPRAGEPVAVAGLDHRCVDVGRTRSVELCEDRLVTGTSDHVLEERTDVCMGLDNQDPRHGRIIPAGRRYPVSLRV